MEKSGVLENQSVTFGNFSNSEIKKLEKSNTKIGKLELESTSSFQTQELENQNVIFGTSSNPEIVKLEKNSTRKMDVLQRKDDPIQHSNISSEIHAKGEFFRTRVLYLPWLNCSQFRCEICNYKGPDQKCFEKHLAGKNHREMMEVRGGIGWKTLGKVDGTPKK